jgi:hypothetical protein
LISYRSIILLGTMAYVLGPAVAIAQSGVVSNRGKGDILVWWTEAAADDARRLIEAKQRDLIPRKDVVCVVPENTEVVKVEGGYTTNRIVVSAGAKRGCQGFVDADFRPVK